MAGESLTPSPVTATTSPIFWHALTIISFWAGVVLANTICPFDSHFYSFFPWSFSGSPSSSMAIWVSSSPWTTIALDSPKHYYLVRLVLSAISLTVSSVIILQSLAIDAAVAGWSPVTMTTLTPAERHFSTAYGTVSLGGSERESTPTKVSPKLSKFSFSMLTLNLYPLGNLSLGRWHLANPSTLYPLAPNPLLAATNFSFHSLVMGIGCPPTSTKLHRYQILSGAPFRKTQ